MAATLRKPRRTQRTQPSRKAAPRPEPTPTAEPEADAPTSGLATLPGMGPALAARAAKTFGTEQAFLEACAAGDVDRIAAVPGIGSAKAAEIVRAARGGQHATSLFGTPRVQELYDRVIGQIVERACTRAGKNHLRLLGPLGDRAARDERITWAMQAAEEVRGLDLDRVRALLADILPLPAEDAALEADMVIFVDKPDDLERLRQAGIHRHATLALARDRELARQVEAGIYAYTDGGASILEADHILPVRFSTAAADVAPWAVTTRFRRAAHTLEAAAALAAKRGIAESPARAVLDLLAQVPTLRATWTATTLEEAATETLAKALQQADARLGEVRFTAADLVRALNREPPEALQEAYREAAAEARRNLSAHCGFDVDPYTDGLPPQVDVDAIKAALEAQRRLGAHERLARLQKIARALEALRPQVEAELAGLVELDARLALGSYVVEHGLSAPEWGEGFVLDDALHLDHSPAGDRIAYRLGAQPDGRPDPHRFALVTGANSGGKTTLLETLAQVAVLAHCGLPVPARHAVVPELDAVHIYAERRSLGAGAFESFLRRFFPLVHARGRILVLADELEAMTELEAAAEILAAFLERLDLENTWALLATHMAPQILPAVRSPAREALRIDGIEARGLDEEGRLVVDRSPRIGVRARSTPELILRRLGRHGPSDLRTLFEELADRVGHAGATVGA